MGDTNITEPFPKDTKIGVIALQCKLAQMEGYTLKKKMKRYNKIEDYHAMTCAGDHLGRGYISECILLCSTDPIYGSLYEDYSDLMQAESWMKKGILKGD